ncbi:MAG TPA: DNA mismatch repair endonuclease MutL, partial [Polyangia bacterium]|nr:DNA mismatch repair endonuclease MutL [Polyangia bacterium]
MEGANPARAKVRVLPAALADQIAAGEVVERPASVVKELVENAIDAGARRIDVEIEAGGRRLVRVVDDGCGMPPDEARLALRRHATSKIAAADDLWGLATFGFRGEALPSIAAVSRLTLATRTADAEAGVELTVEAGLETDARELGMPPGTQVTMRDLFFNTPARAKFLKAEATETANVSEALLRLGLAHPEVHLRLRVGGRVALDLPAHRDLAERVRAALARRGASALHEAAGDENGARVRAFLAGPEEVSTTARSTFLFVGGRFVRDRSLLHALALGYGPLLEKGRYPLAALFLDLPGREVDVNVHPQKLEVRFARAQEVYAAVRHVVGAAIAKAPWLRTGDAVRTFTEPPNYRMPTERIERTADGPARPRTFDRPPATLSLPLRARDVAAEPAVPVESAPAFFGTLNYVGQIHRTYLVCEASDALVLIDQH